MKGKAVSIADVDSYTTAAMADALADYHCPAGYSRLDLALAAAGNDLGNKSAPTALVIVSDGRHMGDDEIEAARALKSAFGDDFDIYAVLVGNDKKGRALLEKAVAAGGDGYLKGAIKTEAKDILSKIATFLVKNTQYVVEIQVHTDSTGTASFNDPLSQSRADSVKASLAGEGVSAGRMTAKGYGASDPIDSNDTAEGRAKNRRVDFKPSER
jgi:hypothetical protein